MNRRQRRTLGISLVIAVVLFIGVTISRNSNGGEGYVSKEIVELRRIASAQEQILEFEKCKARSLAEISEYLWADDEDDPEEPEVGHGHTHRRVRSHTRR